MADLIGSGELQLAADNTHDLPKVPTWHRDAMVIHRRRRARAITLVGPGGIDGNGRRRLPRAMPARRDGHRSCVCPVRAHAPRTRRTDRRAGRAQQQPARRRARSAGWSAIACSRWCFRYVVTEKSMAWMFDHHIDWDSRVASNTKVA